MSRFAVALLILLTLTACATPSSGFPAADAQATLAVVAAQQQAAAESTRQAGDATAAAIVAMQQATQQAEAQATAVAVAQQQAVTATAENLAFAMTAQAMVLDATATAYSMASTQQAVYAVATMEAGIVADEARRLEIARQAEIAAIERGRLWSNWIWPIVAIILSLAVAALVGVFAYGRYQRSKPQPAQQVGNQYVLYLPSGEPRIVPQPRITSPEMPMLPAGEPVARPSLLPALPEGHVLVIGPSQSGKSTTVKVIAAKRPGKVIALDPHSEGGNDWGHAEVIGTSRNFNAIEEYLCFMNEELDRRYHERGEYSRRDFEPLTVAVDETPAIVKALGNKFTSVWATWAREGWKVGLFIVTSSQSDRVRTLGIEGEGDVRENFAFVLYLRDEAIKRYGELVAGMKRPIVLRTPQGAQPIIIPQEDLELIERPSNGQSDGNHQSFVLPAPVYADPNSITRADKARIFYMLREGFSQRAIERDMYGYNGGDAYKAVKRIKDEYDSLNNVRGAVWGAI